MMQSQIRMTWFHFFLQDPCFIQSSEWTYSKDGLGLNSESVSCLVFYKSWKARRLQEEKVGCLKINAVEFGSEELNSVFVSATGLLRDRRQTTQTNFCTSGH